MPVNIKVATEQWDRYIYMRDRGHLAFIEKADRCDNFFEGHQWSKGDLANLKQQRRPALTINKILSTVSTVLGEQIANRNEITFRPKSGSPAETAETLTKVWLQIAHQNQLAWVRSDVFCDGIVRSRGFYDARIDFRDNMKGEVVITQMNSKNVLIDPDAEEYDPDKWNDVIITKWLTPQDIAVLFNEEDAKLLETSEASAFAYGFDSIERRFDTFGGEDQLAWSQGLRDPALVQRNVRVIERQYRKLVTQKHFVDPVNGDMRPVPDSWDRNRIALMVQKYGLAVVPKLVKRIRWTVSADSCVLHDEWSPFKHFTVVPYFPHFRYGRTVGIVENLLGPQELLNKASSQELHVINTTANSGWKMKQGNLVNMSVEELEQNGAQTGLVLELKEIDGAEKILPNQIPQGLERITFKAEEHIKTISAVPDTMQGFDREDVAAKAIQQKAVSSSKNFSKVLDNLERTDWILARNVLDLVQGFYTEERVMNITHDDLNKSQEMVTINQTDPATGEIVNDLTLGEYDIIITSAPFRATLEDSQFEQGMAMREAGIAIPDDVLVENSRLLRKMELVKRMQGDAESPEAQAKAALEARAATAQVSKIEAEAQEKMSSAQLKQAQTAQAAQEAASQNGTMESIEMVKAREEAALERYKVEQEMELARWKAQEEIKIKQQAQKDEALARRVEAARSQAMEPATVH